MTPKIKLCGLMREADIAAANRLLPEYIGFVFAKKSPRFVDRKTAAKLKTLLDGRIKAVGVFLNEDVETAAALLNEGVIDIAQLHGDEDDGYIAKLKALASFPVIKAFKIRNEGDACAASKSRADMILLDSGMGSGKLLDFSLIRDVKRPYFLAGGLNPENVADAIEMCHPYAVDVSSGIETDKVKDTAKMEAFVAAVRGGVSREKRQV